MSTAGSATIRDARATRGIGKTLHSLVSGYRNTTDWAAPTLDQGVRGAAVATVGNLGVMLGIYYARQVLGEAIPQEYITEPGFLSTTLKGTGYLLAAGVLGAANIKAILPLTLRQFETKASGWLPHARMWGALGVTLFVNSATEAPVVQTRFETLKDVVNGEIAHDIISPAYIRVHRRLESLANLLDQDGYELSFEESARVQGGLEDAKKQNPNFPYTDRVSLSTQQLRRNGVDVTPEEMVLLTRLVYFEAGFDETFGCNGNGVCDLEASRKQYEGVMWSMRNRLAFDEAQLDNNLPPMFSRGDHRIIDVAFRRGGRVYEYSAIDNHHDYFFVGPRTYAGDKLNVAVMGMDPRRAEIALETVIGVLGGTIPDPTGGALFYQDIGRSDAANKNWVDRYQLGPQPVTQIGVHTYWLPDPTKPKWKDVPGVDQ